MKLLNDYPQITIQLTNNEKFIADKLQNKCTND